jgi:UDP-galactopyranose mutase
MDIICISTTDWDEILGGRQQIMARLAAKGNRVLFVGRQVGPEHLLKDAALRKRKLKSWQHPAISVVADNLWTYAPPLMPPGRYYSLTMNRLGQSILSRSINRVAYELNLQPVLLWIYPPHSAPLIDNIPHRLCIYHCVDRFAGNQKGLKRKIMDAQELELLQKADLIFTSGKRLLEEHQSHTNKPMMLITNAANIAHFQSTDMVHPEVATLPHPRLGIMGTFDGRIDVPLLEMIAHNRPDWHLVLIGQIRPGRVNLTSLLNMKNVHHLGIRPFTQLPQLLNGMDVLLIPYVQNELTEFINPLKLYEYLAIGAPIVSVPLPEVLHLGQLIAVATRQNFVETIESVLQNDTPENRQERRLAAQKFSWDARVQQMLDVITERLNKIYP